MTELCQRFEEPNDAFRWDKPLFTLIHDDDLIARCGDQLNTALFVRKSAAPRLSTIVVSF